MKKSVVFLFFALLLSILAYAVPTAVDAGENALENSPFQDDAELFGTHLCLTYIISGGEVTITECSPYVNVYHLTIPGTLEGYPVTKIGDGAFIDCTITSIEIPDSVTTIGAEAFSNCTRLTSIEIPDNVKAIRYGTFAGCTSLTSIEISDSVTKIDEYVFAGCTSLISIEIPDSVTAIGDIAFSGCKSLISIEIPDSVTAIGDIAFSGCKSLTSIEIPDSVTYIGNHAFYDCPVTIHGYSGSYAETYANKKGIPFVTLDGESYIPGDLNGDGSVDVNDAILLLQYSMFPELYPIEYAGDLDVTKDGNIDVNDAMLVLQYSMFPELYPIE